MFDSPETPYADLDLADFGVTDVADVADLDAREFDTRPATRESSDCAQTLIAAPAAVKDASSLHDLKRTFPCSERTELFFAPPGERRIRREKREATARSYCDQCSVKEMCKLAGRAGREHGIWGAENDEDRAIAGFAPLFPHRKAIMQAAKDAKQQASLSA